MKKGDVVLITFPFTDLSSVKVRPALVISNDSYNEIQDDTVLLLITSNITRLSPDDYLLESENPEFANTGLKNPSVFRVGKIHTLKKTLLRSKLGFVGSGILKEIEDRLRNLLQL
ncbi:plasmid maintenance toxin/cell growth inhibitor [Candidatus Scalindua japonica]|uniref:Plasmid maintenance toxin/cell growth inhibitor n=1 Tax=Candidatus Scalindua japonica TaxID=1284222 RepID=A0A286U2S4_9BACT|nr:type II toxin-antitoxin system PemK/MazF family toxin [Candidatus Scalindua japonica]GAX62371.1 plasmid maintenance toxin/cell growth inhibitor [Candidatus Scalindua japonica]